VKRLLLLLLICTICIKANCQNEPTKDSLNVNKDASFVVKKAKLDKAIQVDMESGTANILKMSKPHSPRKAWIMSALLPGLGQVYNGQWWKVPIIYGALGGLVAAAIYNDNQYTNYRNAFIDFNDYLTYKATGASDPYSGKTRWKKVYVQDATKLDESGQEWFREALKNKKDAFRRDRDFMYILSGGFYVLNIIDALVYAHFYNFDITEDISMGLQPTVGYNPYSGNNYGLSCTINF